MKVIEVRVYCPRCSAEHYERWKVDDEVDVTEMAQPHMEGMCEDE